MKLPCYLFILLLVLMTSCTRKSKHKETKTIQNLNNQEVAIDSINSFIQHKMKEMNVPGLSYAIINNGVLVYHKTMGYTNMETKERVTQKTIFEAASISKPIFASLVMLLVEEDKLDLDIPLYTYLDESSRENYAVDTRYEKITARMVLSHTTGFPNWRGNEALTISFEPGTDFAYSGEGFQFLVSALESILQTDNQGLEAYFQQHMAVPLGMNHTKFVQDDYNIENKAYPHFKGVKHAKNNWTAKEFNAASAVHTEAEEFSNWLLAIMESSLLSEKSTTALLTDQIEALQAPSLLSEEGAVAWTLGFAKYDIDDYIVYGHEGNNDGFNSLFLFDKDKKWGMVQFNNANEVFDFGFDLFLFINKKH